MPSRDAGYGTLAERQAQLDPRFCEVMDSAPVMIWVSGLDKRCVWFNRPWLSFTGRRMEEEIGEGWATGVHQADLAQCLETYLRHFDARTEFRMQYRLRRHDGMHRWIYDTGIPRYGTGGSFLGYIGSCVDVHDRREAQVSIRRRLLEAVHLNRRADAATVVASISQEIRQPLTSIVSSANAALRWLEKNELKNVAVALNRIVSQGFSASDMIDKISTIFKAEKQTTASVDVNELIRDFLSLVEPALTAHRIDVRTALDATNPVMGDQTQLEHVLLNLIRNSSDAMTSTADPRVLHVQTKDGKDQNVLITVQDSGCGVHPKNINRIFDPFFTTKPTGMGMGLSVSRSIIDAHDGHIWVEPGIIGGSIFRIKLPIGT